MNTHKMNKKKEEKKNTTRELKTRIKLCMYAVDIICVSGIANADWYEAICRRVARDKYYIHTWCASVQFQQKLLFQPVSSVATMLCVCERERAHFCLFLFVFVPLTFAHMNVFIIVIFLMYIHVWLCSFFRALNCFVFFPPDKIIRSSPMRLHPLLSIYVLCLYRPLGALQFYLSIICVLFACIFFSLKFRRCCTFAPTRILYYILYTYKVCFCFFFFVNFKPMCIRFLGSSVLTLSSTDVVFIFFKTSSCFFLLSKHGWLIQFRCTWAIQNKYSRIELGTAPKTRKRLDTHTQYGSKSM